MKNKHYYVVKNGRTISDYDNYEDAKTHARCIDGDVDYEDIVDDDEDESDEVQD